MGGIKRKDAPTGTKQDPKKTKFEDKPKMPSKKSRLDQAAEDDGDDSDEDGGVKLNGQSNAGKDVKSTGTTDAKKFKLETSSAEAHAKQRALAKERKAAKPNADVIQRSKKIWERLRRKSHVPKEERKELVTELFEIIQGRVRDFVFKHDSVRVIQCALKYSNAQQRRMIVDELKADIKTLVESRYGKFLLAKMVVEGDQEIRNIIVPEFYGHVKRLINHPEASWIVDDIYRQVATPAQRMTLLREWYGPEFALANRKIDVTSDSEQTADLQQILNKNPEKRKPILEAAKQLINSLIQKKMTGFTMLHDAMLQYFLALTPGSEEHAEFLEILKGDIDAETEGGGGDVFRNLAFTKSGSRLASLAIAYGTAKDRKIILKCYRDNIELMALDNHAKHVLLTALDVPDDTKMSGKAVFPELLGASITDETQRLDRLEGIVTHLNARMPLLYPLTGPTSKWLLAEPDKSFIAEIHTIRNATSKKEPSLRRQGLLEQLSTPLLEITSKRAPSLSQSSFGCQFLSETLLSSLPGSERDEAKLCVAKLAAGNPLDPEHISQNAAAGRMLKTLVLGGQFDADTKKTKLAEHPLGFAGVLWDVIQKFVVEWACSESSFVVVGLLESEDMDEAVWKQVKAALVKGKQQIEKAASGGRDDEVDKNKKGKKATGGKGNAGAKIVLEKLQ